MKKLKINLAILFQLLFIMSSWAQEDTLFNASNPNGSWSFGGKMAQIEFRTPSCKGYRLTEFGVTTHASSAAGSIKLYIYDSETTNLIFESPEIQVSAGANYYSQAIPAGVAEYSFYKSFVVGIITSSDAIVFERTTDFSNDASGTLLTNNIQSVVVYDNVYPNVSSTWSINTANWTAWYGLPSFTLKGVELPTLFTVNETSGVEDDGVICDGSDISITVNQPFGDSYSWSEGSVTEEISVNPSATTSYTVTVLGAGNCESTATYTVNVIPNPTFVLNTSAIDQLTISVDATNSTYQWINCSNNQAIQGETNSTFTASENGQYAVVVSQNGCSVTSECVTIDNVGLEENALSEMKLYPNPTNNIIAIEMPEVMEQMTILDVTGKEIRKIELTENHTQIAVGDLVNGVYLVQVISKNHFYRASFVKQ